MDTTLFYGSDIKKTSIVQKLGASIINIIIVFIFFLPFYFTISNNFVRKLILIGIFLLYNILVVVCNNNRCIGMILMNTKRDRTYSKWNQILYLILYTFSFSTILFRFIFPFDLLLCNIVLVQLPMVVFKWTTLHWYLSGNMTSIPAHNE